MSILFAVLTFLSWGVADLFYKKSNEKDELNSHLKTGIIVGFVMGIHALIYFLVKKIDISLIDILKYLPVSLCYIISMVIGYKGLKYINLSISSPIQNTSGFITSILLCIIFREILSFPQIIGLSCMFLGVLFLTSIEVKKNRDQQVLINKIKVITIMFPILYCVIDGLGTFLDAVYLDHLSLITEDVALIAYELTFFIYAVIGYLYLRFFKREKLSLFKEKNKIRASLFETIGQFTYVYAISSNSVITVPIVACYSAFSVFLSKIFLKEKLTKLEFFGLIVIFSGIIILALVEG